jgi:hypothetical protein
MQRYGNLFEEQQKRTIKMRFSKVLVCLRKVYLFLTSGGLNEMCALLSNIYNQLNYLIMKSKCKSKVKKKGKKITKKDIVCTNYFSVILLLPIHVKTPKKTNSIMSMLGCISSLLCLSDSTGIIQLKKPDANEPVNSEGDPNSSSFCSRNNYLLPCCNSAGYLNPHLSINVSVNPNTWIWPYNSSSASPFSSFDSAFSAGAIREKLNTFSRPNPINPYHCRQSKRNR